MKNYIANRILATGCLIFLSLVFSEAYAVNCNQYAKTSIKQNMANLAKNCGYSGLRWTVLFKGQKSWCESVSATVSQNETNARNQLLTSCGAVVAPLNWNSLGNPVAWDRFFEAAFQAVLVDDQISIKVMHQHGLNINYHWNMNNGTLLYHAIDRQSPKVARYLVNKGVNPNVTTNGGVNPLAKLLEDNTINYQLLRFLLRKNANPNAFGQYGPTDQHHPLHIAVRKSDSQAVKILLNHGANPSVFDQTPVLVQAIQQGSLNMVKMLVNQGNANVNLGYRGATCSNNVGNNRLPLDYASHTPIKNFLISKGAKYYSQC